MDTTKAFFYILLMLTAGSIFMIVMSYFAAFMNNECVNGKALYNSVGYPLRECKK